MYSPFDPLPQPPPPTNGTSLKRTRSNSPGSLHKKRAPPSYTPSIYTTLPPHLAHSLSHSNGLQHPQPQPHASGVNVSGNNTPGMGGDWVTRTEGLQLATPPPGERGWGWGAGGAAGGEGEGGMEEDVGMAGGGDMEMDTPMDSTSSAPLPASFHSLPTSITHPNTHRTDPPQLPHHAPPLYQHLAGSPQPTSTSMSRSSSSSSSLASEMSISSYPHPQPQPHHQAAPLIAAGVPSLSTNQKRTGGGWKVTFGFRHDCQRCLNKEVGHYSHVVSDEGVFAGQ
ncbi:hypothetical protein BCR35DRAFT_354465 [Leucosporidium creatinivorum]|uniref:Uncharacterized protein n=1 Tax=Leucosporidium creatinivorum TaxID=106004 RepID=A0A1Y2EL09_9BASI|nr:hypothetical protein BCR35DRAFT_354465 [Leucosporidium creatinivorum]